MERKEDDKLLEKRRRIDPAFRTLYPRGIIMNNGGCEK
jgi:hypothetical protein